MRPPSGDQLGYSSLPGLSVRRVSGAVRVHHVDLNVPVTLRVERDAASVRRPAWQAVGTPGYPSGGSGRSRPRSSRRPQVPVTVRVERDAGSVRRPAWGEAVLRVIGQAGQAGAIRVHHVDLNVPVTLRVERDLRGRLGRPGCGRWPRRDRRNSWLWRGFGDRRLGWPGCGRWHRRSWRWPGTGCRGGDQKDSEGCKPSDTAIHRFPLNKSSAERHVSCTLPYIRNCQSTHHGKGARLARGAGRWASASAGRHPVFNPQTPRRRIHPPCAGTLPHSL